MTFVQTCSTSNPTNFFSGSPLNRLSWLRTSQIFLNAVAISPAARWILLKDGQPLVASEPPPHDTTQRGKKSLARLSTAEVRPLLGSVPYFAQGQNDGDLAASDVHVLESARLRGAPIVFLGLHEPNSESEGADALPSSDFSAKADAAAVAEKIKGTPYFTLDVSGLEQKDVDDVIQSSEASKRGVKLNFTDARGALYTFTYFDAAITAEARSMVDWNARNKVCGAPALVTTFSSLSFSFVPAAQRLFTPYGLVGSFHARPCYRGRMIRARSHVQRRMCPFPYLDPRS